MGTAAVVGAGSSGLVAARHLRDAGFAVTVYERDEDLGGNWNYGRPSARVYASTHTISSKPGTEYPDYPMPAELPDYPHHSQILRYLRDYAEHFDLLPLIRFGVAVERIDPLADGRHDTAWRVRAGQAVTDHDVVVIANGHNWDPKYPEYPGTYTGELLHSAEYRTPDVFDGRRVLVVGGGNTGCDIVVEAALRAAHAWHSTRRGYWYMPKYMLGKPTDQVGDALLRLKAPLWLRRRTATLMHRILVGPPFRTGLPRPDHRLLETHPIVNSLLPYYVRHGAITPKPDVERFEARSVFFRDGTSLEVDVVVFATGYNITFPFIDHRHLNWQDGRPRLHLNVFHPGYDTLFVAGLIQPDSGQFGLVHWQMLAAARYAAARRAGHPAAASLATAKATPLTELGGGVKYKESTRHYLEVEHWSYRRRLQRLAASLPATAHTRQPQT